MRSYPQCLEVTMTRQRAIETLQESPIYWLIPAEEREDLIKGLIFFNPYLFQVPQIKWKG